MSTPFDADRVRVAARMAGVLPTATAHPARLHTAMRYACEGGKRLRALLVYGTARVLGLPLDQVDGCACAVELIHAYSLVHDDLPAMDDDDLRRGRPTVHRQYDEATAILVGDALGTLAFEVLATDARVPPTRHGALVGALARASGSVGMVGGQALDLAAEGARVGTVSLSELQDLHRRKTGALIAACVTLPRLVAEPSVAIAEALDRCGDALGLAYQIQDDILDVEASSDALGKTAGKDQRNGKTTYVSLLGLAGARAAADETFAQARNALAEVPNAAPLTAIINLMADREH